MMLLFLRNLALKEVPHFGGAVMGSGQPEKPPCKSLEELSEELRREEAPFYHRMELVLVPWMLFLAYVGAKTAAKDFAWAHGLMRQILQWVIFLPCIIWGVTFLERVQVDHER